MHPFKIVLLVALAIANIKTSSANIACDQTADIVFLVDTSSSIYPGDFNLHVKKFINDVVGSFNVGPGPLDTRVGMVLFSTRAHLQFYLRSYKTAEQVQAAVNRTRFRGGDTYTHKALAFTSRIMLKEYYGAREDVSKLVVVLTDGKSIDEKRTLQEAQKLKDAGVEIFAVGVGEATDFNELSSMASSPSDQFAFRVTDFKALDSIKNSFTRSTCQVLSSSTTSSTTTTTTTTTTTPTTTTTTPTTTTIPTTTTTTTPTTTTTTPTTTTTTTTTTPTTTTTTTTPTTTTTTPMTTRAPMTTTSDEKPQGDGGFDNGCKGKPADIYFLLDASSSVYVVHFQDRVLPFVRDLVSSFKISPLHTRVGLVTFSNEVDHVFGLSSHADLDSLKKAIQPDTVEYLTGGTNTGDAISYVTKTAFGSGEARKGVAQIIITVTDGLSQSPRRTAKAAAEARKEGIYMFAVGVGNFTDDQELMDISSNPDEDFVFSVDDFNALGSITKLLAQKTCKAVAKGDKDDNEPKPNDQAECSSQPTNVVFTYSYMNSISASRTIVQDVITEFVRDVQMQAPHVKIGVVTQPCVSGTDSLVAVSRFQRALAQIRSNYYIGYPGIIRRLRVEVFSRVPLTDNRIAVMFVDENTKNLDLLQEEVRKMKFKNVKVIVVAVGKLDNSVLKSLASFHHSVNVFHVDSYDTLKEQKLNLLGSICKQQKVDSSSSSSNSGASTIVKVENHTNIYPSYVHGKIYGTGSNGKGPGKNSDDKPRDDKKESVESTTAWNFFPQPN